MLEPSILRRAVRQAFVKFDPRVPPRTPLTRGREGIPMTSTLEHRSAVLDSEHVGDIRGALGTIRLDGTEPRRGRSATLKTLLAIVGPGLIVMVGDNDAGAFATYGHAGCPP